MDWEKSWSCFLVLFWSTRATVSVTVVEFIEFSVLLGLRKDWNQDMIFSYY